MGASARKRLSPEAKQASIGVYSTLLWRGGWCPTDRYAEDEPIPVTYPLLLLPGAGYRRRTGVEFQTPAERPDKMLLIVQLCASAAAPVWLFADVTRLEQSLVNLLNNAAKYTDAGGSIELTVQADEGHATVRVRDMAIGIDREGQAG